MAPAIRRQLDRSDSETEAEKNTPCWKKFASIMLSHVGLLFIVIGYAVGGAFIFISLETPHQDLTDKMKKYFTQSIADARKYVVLNMWYQSHQNHTAAQFQQLALEDIRKYHDYVVDGIGNYYYDGTMEPHYLWTFSKAILATFSTITTIGYGQVCPKTFNGQMFAIIYGLIGVPLVLVFLADIGEFLARASQYTYSRGCCVVCRVRRRFSETVKGTKAESVFKEPVGNESYMPTDEVQVPITVNVCVVGAYLALGGVLFKTWEGWAFSEAIYFSFVTLSTIGYGDFVPDNSAAVSKLTAIIKMTVTSAYTLFGMSLLSMCINLIQEQIITKAKWLAKELGIDDHEDIDPAIKYKHRKTEGDVIITPAGKDGNKSIPNRKMEESHMKKFRRRYDDDTNDEDDNFAKLDEEQE